MAKSATSAFGTPKRESHDASAFYNRSLYPNSAAQPTQPDAPPPAPDVERDEFMAATLSVWDILPELAKRVGHPAPFPVELAERVIRLYSYIGDVVLDPFLGSGTTAVAARQTGRRYVGYELEPAYCNLAAARIAAASTTQTTD
jgi:hypothetical protein